jgi:hypothetical protein
MLDQKKLHELGDVQLKWEAMLTRSQLARKRRPVTPQLRARLEAKLPLLLAECERRGIDASWTAYRRLRAEADGKPEPQPSTNSAAEALLALEEAIAAYRAG